jgi:hypothetical protein
MKKIFLLLIPFILAINLVKAQTNWVNYKMSDKLSVKVPEQPVKVDENSVYVKSPDSVIYIISIVDLSKTDGLDSAKLAAQSATPDFAKNFKDSMLSQMAGYTMGDVNIGKWKGYTSYNFDGGNAATKLKVYTYMVFMGSNVYSLMVMFPENKSLKSKDDFFNSLTLN